MATTKDLKIDTDGNLVIEDGDLVLIEDQEVVAQSLRILFQTVQGEWFLNTDAGIDYLGIVFRKGAQQSEIEAHLRSKILGIPHVQEIEKFTAEVDKSSRSLTIEFSVTTDISEDPVDVKIQFP